MHARQSRCRCGVPTLFYDELNPQFRSCYMLIKVLDIEVDLKPINLSNGENLNESYKKMNPSGTLPTLIDGQFTLCDGHTIMIYLYDKYAGVNLHHLWPREYLARLNVLNMLFYEGCVLHQRYSHLLTEILLKKYPNMDMGYHQAKVLDSYNYLENKLKGQSSMTGNSLTIADLSVITTLSGLDLIFPISPNHWPKLHRWFENFKNMECYNCNDEALQKLSHLLATEGQFPVPSLLTLEPTSAKQSSLQPTVDINKEKLYSSKMLENTELPWNGRSSLKEKFFKKFPNDNDRIPTSATLQKSHSPSKGCIIAALSEGQSKKRLVTYLPRIRTSKFRIGPSHTDHETESAPQLEKLYETPAVKEVRDRKVESGVKHGKPSRNRHYKSSECLYCSRSSILKTSKMEWTCMDCVQERVQSAEC